MPKKPLLELKKLTRLTIEANVPLAEFTTMQIGGPARYFARAKTETELITLIHAARRIKIHWHILGEGSNIIPDDRGFRGLIIKNEIKAFAVHRLTATIGAGYNLLQAIDRLNYRGMAGMEKMSGIPGTVGGAIYGCAGAYGQEIKDGIEQIRIFDGTRTRWISKKGAHFEYRESIFKKNKNWIILSVQLKLKPGNASALLKESKSIRALRKKKYWLGLRCPGSFFKNIVLSHLSRKKRDRLLKATDEGKVMHGKLPAGYLLELVGAKGIAVGNIAVAKHHGNLIFNRGAGTAGEVRRLAKQLKERVKKRFGIELEEEIQYL